jgi:hypothetical protein
MPLDEHDQRPLFGPAGRIPAVQAVTLARQSGISAVRKGWRLRHTVAMIVLSPLVFVSYNAALVVGVDDPGLRVLIGAMSLVAALILITYLPLRGAERAAASTCGAMPGLLVVGAGFLIHQATGPLGGALALAILGLALWQRLSGTSACD